MFENKSYGSLINGKWVKSSKTIDVLNPYNQGVIGKIYDVGENGAVEAIKVAQKAFIAWSAETAEFKFKILKNLFNLILENSKEIAEIITLESGKPIRESNSEISYAASFIEWFAEQAKRINGSILNSPDIEKKMFIIKQPMGVVSAITPWNFPLAMVVRKATAAIAAGCTVVLKPSELTPFSALKFGELSLKAGIPPGVLNIINGNPNLIGKILSTHKLVKKITFTGSTKIGKYLMSNASQTVKGISLELGGNAPFIVFEDADLESSIEGLFMCKLRNAGQTCISANRIFIHEKVMEKFIEKLKSKLSTLRIGNGMDNVDVGPLISNKAVQKIEKHILDAVEKGGKLVLGGKKSNLGDCFFEPTIITNVKKGMLIFDEENFGPVIPIISFRNDDELIENANDTEYGLAAYFFTSNQTRVWNICEKLQYGMFGINSGSISTYLNPFGGLKESGIGREGSEQGLEPFLEKKFISLKLN